MGPILAKIRASSPRAEALRRIFGSDTVPLKSATPVIGVVPGLGKRRALYVDVAALSAEQLAETFGADPETIRADVLGDHGLPIRADDLVLSSSPIGSA